MTDRDFSGNPFYGSIHHKILVINLVKSVFQLYWFNGNYIVFNKKFILCWLLDAARQMEPSTLFNRVNLIKSVSPTPINMPGYIEQSW